MNNPTAEIFSQGDEVVTGEIVDTNAAWLARELARLGFGVTRHTAAGDRLDTLADVLRDISTRADLCLCTGGLGPTCDDLTAEAVSRAFGLPLALDPAALAQVEAWFARSGRPMPAVNRKQALLPQGSTRLDNLWGTAPGFAVQAGRCRFVFMPGVPGEMKAMFGRWVEPDLLRRFELRPERLVVLRTVGVGESTLQERLNRIALPPDVRLGFRAGGPENLVKLAFPYGFPESEQDDCVRSAAAAIGDDLVSIGSSEDSGNDLAAIVGQRLRAREATMFIVEGVSDGRLTSRCGGEEWFAGSLVLPDWGQLCRRVGANVGGDPESAAAVVARLARERVGADFALVNASPADRTLLRNGSDPQPVCFALAGADGVHAGTRLIGGDYPRKMSAAAAFTLDFFRRRIVG